MALPSASTATTTSIDAGAASQTALAANTSRKGAIFVNDHATGVIWLKLGATAVANTGIRLNPGGGTFMININNLYTGIVTAIADGATRKLLITYW